MSTQNVIQTLYLTFFEHAHVGLRDSYISLKLPVMGIKIDEFASLMSQYVVFCVLGSVYTKLIHLHYKEKVLH